jgi:hypothetical protein
MHTAERLPVLSPRGPRKSEVWAHLKELVAQNKPLVWGKTACVWCSSVFQTLNILFKSRRKRGRKSVCLFGAAAKETQETGLCLRVCCITPCKIHADPFSSTISRKSMGAVSTCRAEACRSSRWRLGSSRGTAVHSLMSRSAQHRHPATLVSEILLRSSPSFSHEGSPPRGRVAQLGARSWERGGCCC